MIAAAQPRAGHQITRVRRKRPPLRAARWYSPACLSLPAFTVISLDQLVGTQHKCRWDSEPECLCGLEVDHQLELSRLLDRDPLATIVLRSVGCRSLAEPLKTVY